MSGRISWTKEERKRSKTEKKPLFAIAFDTRESDPDRPLYGSFFCYAGIGDQELVDDIIALVKKHGAREKT